MASHEALSESLDAVLAVKTEVSAAAIVASVGGGVALMIGGAVVHMVTAAGMITPQ